MSPIRPILLALALTTARTTFAADWTIDPAHSTIAFTGTQTGNAFTGHFAKFSGTIGFDPDHPESGHGSIVIDTTSAATGDTQRDGALPGADWFDIAHFPQARFDIARFTRLGGDRYEADGHLTIKGVGQDEKLPFTLVLDGDTAHAKGHLGLTRSAFNVGQGPWTSGQWVGLDVGVDLDITAHRAH